MNADLIARRFIVSGRVQGVGYRNYVERVADKMGLHGYVRNRRDGSVEVLAMGPAEKLRDLRVVLKKGPMMARVDDLLEEPAALEPKYSGQFTIELTER